MTPADDLPMGAIRQASGDGGLTQAVCDLLVTVDDCVAQAGWVCRNRGLCCDFATWGHDLFVTTAELAYFVGGQGPVIRMPVDGRCPYHQAGVCVARAHRPVGCRIFFCDPASDTWQGQAYQEHRPAIISLHDRFGLPYRYVEWLSALSRLAGD